MADAEAILRVANSEVEVLRDNLATRKVILRLELDPFVQVPLNKNPGTAKLGAV